MAAVSNHPAGEPARDATLGAAIPAPMGSSSLGSLASGIFNVVREGAHIVSGFATALPQPVLEALVHKIERGTPATNAPQLNAATPAQQAMAIDASAAAGAATQRLVLLAALGFIAWKLLR